MLAIVGATIGKLALLNSTTDERVILTENCAKITLKQDTVLPDFLLLVLQTRFVQKQIQLNFIQTTLPKLGLDRVSSLFLPPPPTKEKQIDILNYYSDAFIKKQKLEAEAKALLAGIDSYLLDKLGIKLPTHTETGKKTFYTNLSKVTGNRFDPFYHKKEFEELETSLKNGRYRVEHFSNLMVDLKNGVEIRNYSETGFRYLRVTDLDKHEINNLSMRFVDVDKIPDKIKLNKNCILIARSGSLGLVSVVTDELMNSILSSHIFKVELNTDLVEPEYLESYLRSLLGQKQFFRKNNGGVIPEISQNALKSIQIPLPPFEIQEEITAQIKTIRYKARQLENEAKAEIEKAKAEVEKMILGEEISR